MRTLPLIALAGCASTPVPSPAPPTAPAAGTAPTVSTVTGDVHDFDAFEGGWTFTNRRLKQRHANSHDYDEFPAVSCTRIYLGGMSNVDEVHFSTKGWAGLTVRTFDVAKKQWSIYWVNSRDGVMYPPVVGGFTGDDGNFYGDDHDDGVPVKVRFHWDKRDKNKLVWEQYFSYDGGQTWEMNWTNTLTRGDEAALCDRGRPKT